MRFLRHIAGSRVPEAVLLSIAGAFACYILVAPLVARLQAWQNRMRWKERPKPTRVWRRGMIEKDGTPRIHVRRSDSDVVEITELNGTPVASVTKPEPSKRVMKRAAEFYWREAADKDTGYARPGYRKFRWGSTLYDGYFFLKDVGWIVHYDGKTRLPDFYVSPSGVHDSPPGPDDRFREGPGLRYLAKVEGKARKGVSTRERFFAFCEEAPHRMEVIYTARAKRFKVTNLRRRRKKDPASEFSEYDNVYMFAILDGNNIVTMDHRGNVETTVTVPEGILRSGHVFLWNDEDVGPLVVWPPAGDGEPNRVLVFDRDGNQIAEHEWTDPVREERQDEDYARRNAVIVLLALFLVCAGVCLWHGRRKVLSKRAIAAWTAFSLLTGPAGLAVYFGVNDFPPLVDCHSCGKKRPADRDTCPHCAAGLPERKLTGIEIIEPVGGEPVEGPAG